MNIFLPYKSPLECAKILDTKRLNKQIIECQAMLNGKWSNHPVYKMYFPKHEKFVYYYMHVLDAYRRGYVGLAELNNDKAIALLPEFVSEEFCNQMKRRLYTKNPVWYALWKELGTSEENWYFVDEKWVKYINGKKI